MTKLHPVVGDALLFLAHGIRPEEVVQLTFDPLHAKLMCVNGLAFLEKHRAFLEKQFPNLDLTELDVLPELCDRVWRAQRETENFRQDENPLRELVAGTLEWRRKLFPLAQTLVASGVLEAAVFERIHAGRGTANHVQDVVDLTIALEPHKAFVTTAYGKDALAIASASAASTIKAMGGGSKSKADAQLSGDLRDRYATLVIQRHDRLRVVVGLVSSFKLAQTLVGGLRTAGRRKAKPPPAPAPVTSTGPVAPSE